jgi:hypothetical protein
MYTLVLLFSIPLLMIVVSRWVRARGGRVSYFFSQHPYNPDYPDYQDDERPKEYQRDEWPKSNITD